MKKSHFFSILFTLLFSVTLLSAQKNQSVDIVKTYLTAIDAGDAAGLGKVLATNYWGLTPMLPAPINTEGWIGMSQSFKQAFPDMKHETLDWIVDGKKVAIKGRFTGTNTGAMMGNPATGRKVVSLFTSLYEIDDNWKIKSLDVKFDAALFQSQLMPPMASADQLRQMVRSAYDALNRRDYETFKKNVTADFVELTAGPAPIKGVEPCIEAYKMFFALAPDLKFEITNLTVEGNKVVVESTTTGTNTGSVMGMLPATGKKFKTMDVDIIMVNAEGKAISHGTANPNSIFQAIGYGSLANPNVGVVMSVYQSFGKGDVAGIVANCADNIVWDAQTNPAPGAARHFTGKAGIPDFFAAIAKGVDVTKFEPTRFVADGDDVFTSINVGYKLKGSTKIVEVPFIHHFRIENGKITMIRELVGKPMSDMMAKR